MSLRDILDLIEKHQTFLIASHVHPDPDALASQLAVAKFLELKGKTALIYEEAEIPERYRFLPGVGAIQTYADGQHVDYDVAVIVDCGDLDRVGQIKRLIDPDKPVINIDHHVTNDGFGSANFVNTRASSTAEIIYDLIEQAKVELTEEMAVLLYLGIMTDTGSFRYDNTSARTHAVVAELMKFPFPVDELYRKLYEMIPYSDMIYFTEVVNSAEAFCNGEVISLELTQAVVQKFSKDFDLRDKIFRYLRAIKGAELFVIFTEREKHSGTRVNFRSHGKYDVARLAERFNGGGHQRASGCVVEEPLKETKQHVLTAIDSLVAQTLKGSS